MHAFEHGVAWAACTTKCLHGFCGNTSLQLQLRCGEISSLQTTWLWMLRGVSAHSARLTSKAWRQVRWCQSHIVPVLPSGMEGTMTFVKVGRIDTTPTSIRTIDWSSIQSPAHLHIAPIVRPCFCAGHRPPIRTPWYRSSQLLEQAPRRKMIVVMALHVSVATTFIKLPSHSILIPVFGHKQHRVHGNTHNNVRQLLADGTHPRLTTKATTNACWQLKL